MRPSLYLHHHHHQQQQRRSSSSSSVVRASSDDDKGTADPSPSSSSATSVENAEEDDGEISEKTAGAKGAIKFRLAFALPWRRFKSDSVLVLDVSGGIGEKRTGRFAPSALTMPQVRV